MDEFENIEEAARRKAEAKRRLFIMTALFGLPILIMIIVIIVLLSRPEDVPEEPVFEDSSPVQTEINELDWIVPMPLTVNEYSRPGTPIDEVNGIVIHYIGNPGTTAEQNRNYFERLATSGETSVSSNFIVSLDGTIIQCIPVDEVAYASNHRNADTLSIEVCHPDETGQFNTITYASVVRLAAWLCDRFNLTADDVLRHYDVTGKECPMYYVKNEDAWERLKSDIADEMIEIDLEMNIAE